MSSNLSTRIIRLEERMGTRTCVACYGHPIRLRYEHSDTGETMSNNYPEDECPECGAHVYREIVIVVPEEDELLERVR